LLRIRLQRRGRRKRPIHHIVVADNRKPRDGRIIEDIGRFDNVTPKNELELDRARALHWLKNGAQPSDTIRSIFKNEGIMYEMHLNRLNKSEEEIEEALTEWRENREEKKKDVPTRKERQKTLLEAEEKEFQKQLKKKAEEAAREKATQEALAAEEEKQAEAEKAEEAKASDEKGDEAEAAAAEETNTEETATDEVQETEKAETTEESTAGNEEEAQTEVEDETQTEDEGEEAQASEAKEPEEEQKGASAPEDTDEAESDGSQEGESAEISADMLAKDAIAHIEETPLEELEGFVTDEEDRVTVQRALEEKQENEEE